MGTTGTRPGAGTAVRILPSGVLNTLQAGQYTAPSLQDRFTGRIDPANDLAFPCSCLCSLAAPANHGVHRFLSCVMLRGAIL
jgi:hypothetical protein